MTQNNSAPPPPDALGGSVVAQIVITLDQAGNVSVNGPLANRLMLFGMLELAKDAINRHHTMQQQRITMPPPGTMLRPV